MMPPLYGRWEAIGKPFGETRRAHFVRGLLYTALRIILSRIEKESRMDSLRDRMFWRFRMYGLLKNLRFFDPFLILFFREAGLTYLAIGSLYAIREVGTNLLEIPTGVVADAFGRRRAMIASFAAYLGSFALFTAFSDYSAYGVAMVLFALGEALRSGTHKAMILEYLRQRGFEERSVAYYGRTRAASQFGSALAALIGAGVVFWAGSYRVVFLASMAPYVLALFLLVGYPKELDGHVERITWSWRSLSERLRDTIRMSIASLKQQVLLRGLLSGGAFDAVFRSTKDYLQPILQAQALALPLFLALREERRVAVVVGGLFFVIYLATSFAASRAGAVRERAPSLSRAINGFYLVGMGLLAAAGLSAWVGWEAGAIVAYLLLYVAQNVRRPMIVGYVSERIDHRMMATGLSVETQLRTVLTAIFAPLLGLLADRLSVGAAVLILGGLALVAYPIARVRENA
jgi:MFS family permease